MEGWNTKRLRDTIRVDEVEAVKFAARRGLIHNNFLCLLCGEFASPNKDSKVKDGICWRCSNRTCMKKRSIRTNSFFSSSNIPMSTMLELIYLWSTKGSQQMIQRELELSTKMVVDWCLPLVYWGRGTLGRRS